MPRRTDRVLLAGLLLGGCAAESGAAEDSPQEVRDGGCEPGPGLSVTLPRPGFDALGWDQQPGGAGYISSKTAAVTAVEADGLRLGDLELRLSLPDGEIDWPAPGDELRIVSCDEWCGEGSSPTTTVFRGDEPWLVHFACGRLAGGQCEAGFSVRSLDPRCPHVGDCCKRRPGLLEWTTPEGTTVEVFAGEVATDPGGRFLFATGADLEQTRCCDGDYAKDRGDAVVVRSAAR